MKDSKRSFNRTPTNAKTNPVSEFTLSTGKYYNESTSCENPAPCLTHMSETITHFCESCQYQPLCGICLQEGKHKLHSVKNVEKTSKIVHRALTEILITTRAKFSLLEMLNDQVQSHKLELKNELNEFLQTINSSFDAIEDCLLDKKKSILNETHEFYRLQVERIQQASSSTKQEIDKLNSMIEILSEKSEKLEPSYLCLFYYEKKDVLQESLVQGNMVYEDLKRLVPYIKWSTESNFQQKIKEGIRNIKVETCEDGIQLLTKKQEEKAQSVVVKQLSFLKQEKSKKAEEHFQTTGFYTPNHIQEKKSSSKIAKQMKQSKKLLTLVLHDSLQKVSPKARETPTMLHKKMKNKPKYEKEVD